jgi:hypothetical protein
MSVAEYTIPIKKSVGTVLGFTLIRNTCTINRVVDSALTDVRPGDLILRINGIEVNDECVRNILRECRDMADVLVTVARSSYQPRGLSDSYAGSSLYSPTNNHVGVFACFCRPSRSKNPNRSTARPPPATEYSPRGAGSGGSLSSAGMRPLDLRKMKREGVGTMWINNRTGSIIRDS